MIHTMPVIDMVKTGQNIMNLRVAAWNGFANHRQSGGIGGSISGAYG